MLEHRTLFGLLIGLTVCISIWRISIQEPSMMAIEARFSKQYKSKSRYQYQQQDQQEKQSILFSTKASKINNYRSAMVAVGESHQSKKINNTNYFIGSYLQNRNYNLSLVNYPYTVVNYKALQKDDISNLIDLRNFEFIINQKSCLFASSSLSLSSPGTHDVPSSSLNVNNEIDTNKNNYTKQTTDRGSLLLLILVHSAPENYDKRLQIRETWGSVAYTVKNNVRLLFLIGALTTIRAQYRIAKENKKYSDIIQGNFKDNYWNMTYKHVMALKWITYYCPNAKYILKTDDDIFVHTPNLIGYLSTVADRHNLLFCWKQNHEKVNRRKFSKWRVSVDEYSAEYYPPYCRGFAIVYSPDVAFRIYLEAQKTPFFRFDDVHVTGTLAQQANITIKTIAGVILKEDKLEDILNGTIHIDAIPFLFVWHSITDDQIKKLWELLIK